ncbi:Cathepsin W [Entamoeba marina]
MLFFLFVSFTFASLQLKTLCADKKYVSAFSVFKQMYNKSYSTQSEEIRRMALFVNSHKTINYLNSKRKNTQDASFGFNSLSDLTPEEFSSRYLTKKTPTENISKTTPKSTINTNANKKNSITSTQQKFTTKTETSAPTMYALCGGNVAYNTESDGKVDHCQSSTMDQGSCGCCYAISVAHLLQIKHHLETSDVVKYSLQQLIDCTSGSSSGCCGGFSYDVLNYNRAFSTLENYPYRDYDNSDDCETTCYTVNNFQQTLTGYDEHQAEEYDSIKQLIYENKGVLSGIYVPTSGDGLSVWQYYESGVMDVSDQCSLYAVGSDDNNIATNHMVVLIGYGTEAQGTGVDPNFIIFQNSWGTSWGDDGTAKISSSSLCGIGGCDGYKSTCPHPTIISFNTTIEESTEQDYGCLEGHCSDSDCTLPNCIEKDLSSPPDGSYRIIILFATIIILLIL